VADYYCEVIAEHGDVLPGIYMFTDEARYGLFGNHNRLVQMSHRVSKEANGRVVWIKNRSRAAPDLLTQDELKEFTWIKLKAQTL